MLGNKPGHQFCGESADLLRVEVAHLLREVNKRGDNLAVTFFLSLLKCTPLATNLKYILVYNETLCILQLNRRSINNSPTLYLILFFFFIFLGFF